jgi:hypothetical protein
MKPRRRCRTWLIRAERIGAQSVAGLGEGRGARSAADVAVLAGTAFFVELVQAAADCGVDVYESWQDSWETDRTRCLWPQRLQNYFFTASCPRVCPN